MAEWAIGELNAAVTGQAGVRIALHCAAEVAQIECNIPSNGRLGVVRLEGSISASNFFRGEALSLFGANFCANEQ